MLFLLLLPASAWATEYKAPTSPYTEPALGSGESSKCPFEFYGEGTVTEKILSHSEFEQTGICETIQATKAVLAERLFWLADEVVHEREVSESEKTEIAALKTELVKGLGTEGAIAKDLATLTTDLTPSEGLPVKFKTAQAVTLASLPELHSGTQAIGSVKVSALEGEPVVKAKQEGSWSQVVSELKGEPIVKAAKNGIWSVAVSALEGEPIVKAMQSGAWSEVISKLEGDPEVKTTGGGGGAGCGAEVCPVEVKNASVPVADSAALAQLEANQESGIHGTEVLEQVVLVVIGVLIGLWILGVLRGVLERAAG